MTRLQRLQADLLDDEEQGLVIETVVVTAPGWKFYFQR